MSDDLAMKAMEGNLTERAAAGAGRRLRYRAALQWQLERKAKSGRRVSARLQGESLERAQAAMDAVKAPKEFDVEEARRN